MYIHIYIYIYVCTTLMYIWEFLDFNVHQPSTGHNFYFGPEFFGFDILGGNGVHGGVQASPNSKYMGVKKIYFFVTSDMAAIIYSLYINISPSNEKRN